MSIRQFGSNTELNFSWVRTLPIIIQTQSSECGLACLGMIGGYYGQHVDLSSLRRRFSIGLQGANLSRLIQIAQGMGMNARPIRLELEVLAELRVPCILHWTMNHFIVLKSVKKKKVTVHDPAYGKRVLTMDEVSRCFTGIALELIPGSEFHEAAKRPTISLQRLTGRIVGLRQALANIFFLAVVLELLALFSPLFLQAVADQVLANDDSDLLHILGVGFLILVIVQAGISLLRTWSVMCLGISLNVAWSTNVFGHLLKLPEQYFQQRHIGDIASRFSSVTTIQQTVTTRFVEILFDGLMATLTFFVLLVYSRPLALIAVSALSAYAIVRVISYRTLKEAMLGEVMASARQQSLFLEALRGVRAIRLQNQGASVTGRYSNAAVATSNRSISVQRYLMGFTFINSVLFGSERVALIWVGATLTLGGQLTAGMLLASIAFSDQFTARASACIDYGIELGMLRLHAERLADIVLEEPEEYVDTEFTGALPPASIELRDVGFRYSDTDPWIIRKCNIHVAAGESVALIGPSGSGKSTLTKLIVGLLEPQEGSVLVGGIELHRLGKSRFRGMTSVVTQEDQLFAGSLADNISSFEPDALNEDVEAAAKAASIHDEIMKTQMGYQTMVGDMGAALSGGQKQRVLLARALYRKPKVLVLDEATNQLDLANERHVNEAVKRLSITRIIVAHRAESIATADRVIVIGGGPDLIKLQLAQRST